MLNEEFLTQDIDILPDDISPEEVSAEWILPDQPVPAVEEVKTPDTEGDTELEQLLAWVAESTEEVVKTVDDATASIEWVKEKVEEVQANPESSDEMLREIYQDLLTTETALQATEIAKDVALAKVSELQAQVSELEINAAWQYATDNPDLMIINKLYGAAEGGSDIATPKVKDALNKIYLSLFNTSIEDGQVNDNIAALETWTGGVSLNEWTLPAWDIALEEEDTDINDITSILG